MQNATAVSLEKDIVQAEQEIIELKSNTTLDTEYKRNRTRQLEDSIAQFRRDLVNIKTTTNQP